MRRVKGPVEHGTKMGARAGDAGRRSAWLVGLLAIAALAALPGATLLTEPASAVPTPVTMTSVCVNSAQGQMSYPIGGTCPAGQTSYPADNPAQLLDTCYLLSNGAIRKVSSSNQCSNAPRSKKESYLQVPSLTTDLYFCADNTSGGLYFKGTSPVNCPAKQFLVVVKQANHPPVASAQSVSVNEDAPVLITLSATDQDDQNLTFTAAAPSHGSLGAVSAADCSGVNTCTATVTYTPTANYYGPDSFTFKANDGFADSAPATVSITVNPVNDAPSFTRGPDQTVAEDAAAQTVTPWATGISPGPNESGQTVSFAITGNTNTSLFSAGPAVASNGTLTYTPAANANGEATITLKAVDDGGTANGGVDQSAPQSFKITVTAVNDAPSFNGGGDQTVLEDSGAQSTAWATAISAGPADEAGQTVSFIVTGNTNPTLFSAGPSVAPNGTLTYTPAPDANGEATITVKAVDDGAPPAESAPTSFKITVTPVNDAPSFDTLAGNPPAVNEDVTAQTVNGFATGMSAGPANESGQTLTFVIVSNTNEGLFNGLAGQPLLNAANGNLTYSLAPDASGSAVITIKLMDDGGTANGGVDDSPTQQFTITVNPVNDAPSFQLPATPDQTVLEDSGANSVPGFATAISKGPADESGQTLTFHSTNGNNALFSVQPAIDPSTGELTYTVAPNANGSAFVSVWLSDDGGTANGGDDTSDPQNFQITVTAVNDEPSFDLPADPDQTVVQDLGPQTVSGFATNIVAGPSDESGQALTFHTSNDNTALFATQPSIDESSGDLTYESATGATGTAKVSVYLTDDGGTADGGDDTSQTKTFKITVSPPNATPVADGQSVQATEDTLKTITLTATDADDDDLTFSIVASPTHGSLGSIGTPDCTTTPNTCTADVDYTPDANYAGSDSFTFKANDGTIDSNTATVDIDVAAINDDPSFTKGADETVLEDAGAQTVDNWATAISPGGGADEAGQTVTFTVTNDSNAALFSVGPAVSSNGTLTYTPAADAFGSATITLKAVDDGTPPAESATQSFVINVTGVNDAPSFTKGADQSVAEDAGAQTVAGWATGISAGPNESGQTVSFVVTSNSDPSLFSAVPAVSPTGTLTYTPAANQHGTATITLKITDNGGIANGGIDESATQTFDINVTAVNDPPTSPGRAYGADSLETNMKRSILAASGLLVGAADANDVAGNAGYTPTFTVGTVNGVAPSGGTITTTIAGVGTVVADAATGAFTIDPAPGVTGNVSFNFTVCDIGEGTPASQCSLAATASFNISGPVIWFVNPSAATNGSGTLASPFNVLSSADAVDAAGHRVFVYSGSTTSGLALNSDEWLVGQGVTGVTFDTLMGISPPTGTIARPTLGGARPTIGGTVALNTNALVRVLDISPGSGVAALTDTGGHTGVAVSEASATGTNAAAVDLNGTGGSVTLSSVTSSGSAGSGIALTNVTASFTGAAGSVANATAADVAISGGTGSFTYDGSISDDVGTLVSVSGATGGTKSFNGSLTDGDDGDGSGISLAGNGGATVNFTGGLILSTGANAAFTATGGGTVNVTGSPATIATTTGTALNVTSTNIGASGMTFRSISSNGAASGIVLNGTGASGGLTVTGTGGAGSGGTIQNSTNSGILATSTKNLSLTSMNITNNGNAVNEGGIRMTDVTGSGGITSSTVSGGFEDNIYLRNDTATALTFTIHGPSCSITNNSSVSGNNGINILAATSANVTATVDGCSFSGNRAVTIGADSADNSTLNVTIKNNTITQGSPNHGNQGIQVSDAGNGNVTFDVENNKVGTPDGTTVSPLMNTGINIFNGTAGNSVMAGKVINNVVLNDPTFLVGVSNGFGIRVFNSNLAQIRAKVTGNTVRNVNADYGILAESSGTAAAPTAPHGRLDVEISSNNVNVNAGALDAIRAQARNFNTLCGKIASNTTLGGGAGFFGIFIRQANSAVFDLDGWNGVGLPEAYVLTQNPTATTAGSAGTITGVAPNTCNFTGIP
jgi:VCBS repeat-containing protein